MNESTHTTMAPPADQNIPGEDLSSLNEWSWGAFVFNVIWGIGNRVWIALLAFIPLINIIMMFVLGFKGKKWAWETGSWNSIAELNASQKTWDRAGKFVFALWVISIAFVIIFGGILIQQFQSELQNIEQISFENMMLENEIITE